MKQISLPCSWTVQGLTLHVQIPGHSGNRIYGQVIDRSFQATNTTLELFAKNEANTKSMTGSGKPYRKGTAIFNYSLVLTVVGENECYGTQLLLLYREDFA